VFIVKVHHLSDNEMSDKWFTSRSNSDRNPLQSLASMKSILVEFSMTLFDLIIWMHAMARINNVYIVQQQI
jgi:hypothetical protein